MIIEGYDSKTQPREFYENSLEYIPNAASVAVEYVDAGHFWSMERPQAVTALIRKLLHRPRPHRRKLRPNHAQNLTARREHGAALRQPCGAWEILVSPVPNVWQYVEADNRVAEISKLFG